MTNERVLAATTYGALKTEIREYALPDVPPTLGFSKLRRQACAAVIGRRISPIVRLVSWVTKMLAAFIGSA